MLMGSNNWSKPDRNRIQKELTTLWVDPPDFCRPGASPVTDILHWEVVIDGPDGSPYAGGTFPVDIDFIGNYPFKPPKITFKTKVYHPNISSEGELMLDIFHYENWRAAMSVDKLLLYIVSVLYDPVLDCDPINEDIADIYAADLEVYEGTARAWTWEYSSTPIVSHPYPTKKDTMSWSTCRCPRCHNHVDARSGSSAYKEKKIVVPEAREILVRRDDDASSPAHETRIAVPELREILVCRDDDASSPAHEARIAVPRETWKSVVAFLRGCTVAMPFPTFRRRFPRTILPLSYYSGRACF